MNSNVAYDYIRQKILEGEFHPGDFLSAQSLSGDIGVSRTPVREALLQLENDGLVEITPRLGAVVKSMSFQEFKNLCEIRLAFETFAAGLAAERHTKDDLDSLETCLETMRVESQDLTRDSADEEWNALGKEDVRFHVAVVEAGHNELLLEQILRFQFIHRVVSLSGISGEDLRDHRNNPADVWESHLKIFEAIRKRDKNLAIKRMNDHLQAGIEVQLTKMRSLNPPGSRMKRMGRHGLTYSGVEE
jgi:DNA-binding GntR family transcriptional regulator